MKDQLLNKVENIVSKDEIARFEKFLLLSQYVQKVYVCMFVVKG